MPYKFLISAMFVHYPFGEWPVKASSWPSHQLVNDLNQNQDHFSSQLIRSVVIGGRGRRPITQSCCFVTHVADLHWLWLCCWRTPRTTCGRPLRRCSRTGPDARPSPSSRYGVLFVLPVVWVVPVVGGAGIGEKSPGTWQVGLFLTLFSKYGKPTAF